jgi:molybdopterin-containing oxidoreductase family membrane subunit
MVTYGYACEIFTDWYSGSPYELGQLAVRFKGPMAPFFWALIFCNCIVVQTFWSSKLRKNLKWVWVASIVINVGMWLERFVIVVISLHRDFVPSAWGTYHPTWVDISIYAGSFGLFGTLFLLFLKFLPAVAVTEVKELSHEMHHEAAHHEAHK